MSHRRVPVTLETEYGATRPGSAVDSRTAAAVVHLVEHVTARAGVGMLEPELRSPTQVEAEQLAGLRLDDQHRVTAMRAGRRPPVVGRRHGPHGSRVAGRTSRYRARVRWTVSVKGIVQDEHGVLLALNERGEWELPGGQLEEGETPEQCVVREVLEETSLAVTAQRLLGAWVFEVIPGRQVLILAYACALIGPDVAGLRASAEHQAVRFVGWGELDRVALPVGYRRAIDSTRPPISPAVRIPRTRRT